MLDIKNKKSKASHSENEFICNSVRRNKHWNEWYVPQTVFNTYLKRMQVYDTDNVSLISEEGRRGHREVLEENAFSNAFSFTEKLLIADADDYEFSAKVVYRCAGLSLNVKSITSDSITPVNETIDAKVQVAPTHLLLSLKVRSDKKPLREFARLDYISSACTGGDYLMNADWLCLNGDTTHMLNGFKQSCWTVSKTDNALSVIQEVEYRGKKYELSKPLQGLLAMQTLFYHVAKDNF